jgi:isoaspartyl peptidase/L-asparaginase-like protein (Ntn-hydrolase superfamily)
LPDEPHARPVIAIHAGAGDHAEELKAHEAECRDALLRALEAARDALDEGLDASRAAERAVIVMEDFELFNAGRGSTLCSDGAVEMSAALMRGSDRAAGAVAGARHTQNAILGARAVLESPHVFIVGPTADEQAAQAGVRQRPAAYFITERQQAALRKHLAAQTTAEGSAAQDRATVGAVCLDEAGVLAAATSTGGIRGQPPARVGDCPIVGAGTWADGHAAVSCTGDGEAFIRCATAKEVAALVRQGTPLAQAADDALDQIAGLQASGGLIAVDREGQVAMPFITPVMPRGLWHPGKSPQAWIV